MEYNETTAREIQEKFNVPETTIRVWKHRGKIPKKFLDPDFVPRKPITASEIKKDKFLKIISSEKINIAKLAENTGVKYTYLHDVMRGRSIVAEKEFVLIKTRINEIRIEAKSIIETYNKSDKITDSVLQNIKKFLSKNREIVISKVFEEKKWVDIRAGKNVNITYPDYKKFIDQLVIFVLETRM